MRGLPKDLANIVGAHLAMAGALMDDDPELALAHAQAARRRAARLPVVREATAEAAYNAGDWATALTEYRALFRMSGSGDYLPVMADCERALGKPREALKLARDAAALELDPAMQLEMTIVEAGARADLGQVDEALRLLQAAITSRQGPKEARARLHYAAADLLEQRGLLPQALEQFATASALDTEEVLDASMRVARLGGKPNGGAQEHDVDIIAMGDDDDEEFDEGSPEPEPGVGALDDDLEELDTDEAEELDTEDDQEELDDHEELDTEDHQEELDDHEELDTEATDAVTTGEPEPATDPEDRTDPKDKDEE